MMKQVIIGVGIAVVIAGLGLLGYHVYDVHEGFKALFEHLQTMVQ